MMCMKKKVVFSFILFLLGINSNGQDLKVKNDGIIIPQIDRTLVVSPEQSQLIWDINSESFWYYKGSSWLELENSAAINSMIEDADGDTKITVEELSDEDIIRFYSNGEQRLIIRQTINNGTIIEPLTPGENTSFGEKALQTNIVGPISGLRNTFVGFESGKDNRDGSDNTAVGANTLELNFQGMHNTAIGSDALKN